MCLSILKNPRLLASLSAALLLAACGPEDVALDEAPEIVRPVRWMEVQSATAAGRVFAGVAQAPVESRISFRVSGTIESLPVKLGQIVQRGALLAKLDSSDLNLQLQQADAALALSQAQARNAKANYERLRALYENQSVSRNELDAARASHDSSRAQVRANRKARELARQQLNYATLRSPFEQCVVAALVAEERENVSAGQVVMALGCGDTLDVEVSVPEGFITALDTGDAATIQFDSLPNEEFSATVFEVSVAPISSPTYPVRVRMQGLDPRLRTGMSATVRFVDSRGDDRILLPAHAVQEDRQGRYVFTLVPAPEAQAAEAKATGEATNSQASAAEQAKAKQRYIAKRQMVEIGDLSASGLQITKGLAAGDKVVTAGVSKIIDGQVVRVLPELGE